MNDLQQSQTRDTLTPMSAHTTPQHVAEYNARGLDESIGMHFDDPRMVTGEASGMYGKNTKGEAPARGTGSTPVASRPSQFDDAEIVELVQWLAQQRWSTFAIDLSAQFLGGRDLSPRQLEAAKSMRAKVEARNAQRAPKVEAPAAKDSDLDLSELEDGYYAVPDGETRLKVRINRPGANSKWNGFIFVSDGAEYGSRTNYGRQAPGETYKGQIQDQLRKIMEQPNEAMAEYGKLTGNCGRCNRILEDETSVALGIGPICRNK